MVANLKKIKWGILYALCLSLVACGTSETEIVRAVLSNSKAGDIISRDTVSAYDTGVSNADSIERLRYAMPRQGGGLTQANTLVFIPKGIRPLGGWPLIAWGHGTTGISDACSLSDRFRDLGDLSAVAAFLDAGYAVVAPDYEGLGSVDSHPYYGRESHANSMLYAVKAAKDRFADGLSNRWMAAGHSQGGHAALSTAQDAARLGAAFNYVGTIAFAPGTDLVTGANDLFSALDEFSRVQNVDGAGQVTLELAFYGTLVAYGMIAQDSNLALDDFMGKRLARLAPGALNETICQGARVAVVEDLKLFAKSGGDFSQYEGLKRDWNLKPGIAALIERNKVGVQKFLQPVLILQGTDDTIVGATTTAQFVNQARALGSTIELVVERGATHNSILTSQINRAIKFADTQFSSRQ